MTLDREKEVNYWRTGAEEDLAFAADALERGYVRQGMFFLHLALEKALKAGVCLQTGEIAPRSHNLALLADLTGWPLPIASRNFLQKMRPFNLEGRYPDVFSSPLPKTEALSFLSQAEEIIKWLICKLSE